MRLNLLNNCKINFYLFFDLLFEEPSPGPVKYLLTETWEDVGSPLMPITNVSNDLASKLLENLQKIKNN